MATTQGDVLQQAPTPAPQSQAPTAVSEPRPVSTGQAPLATPHSQQPAANTAAGGQAPSSETTFSQIIEQQIAQAIQPVLDEFRQNVAQAMEQQMAPVPSSVAGVAGTGDGGVSQTAPHGQGTQQPIQPQQPIQGQIRPSAGNTVVGQTLQQTQPQQPVQQGQQPQQTTAQPPQQSSQQPVQQPPPAGPVGSASQTSARPESGEQPGLSAPISGALQPALQATERQGVQWLQSLLVAGLGALLAETTHAAIQQRAEQGLHTLLQKLFEAVPDGFSNQEMQVRTERTLQTILRESLDAIFAGGVRTTVQQGGQQAIQESFHGDFGGALQRIRDTLKAMAEALLTVLRRQWQSVLRLLLALVLLALESSLAQSTTDK